MSLLIFDFSVGAGSPTRAFAEAGHTVMTWNLDVRYKGPDTQKFMKLEAESLIREYGRPDFIWSSPPCITFSVASLHHHWGGGKLAYEPKTEDAKLNLLIIEHLRDLILDLDPTYGFMIENPRGVLRKLPLLAQFPRHTITYCSYGDDRMKPTDLWTDLDTWVPRPKCSPGSPDHIAAPRGSSTGTIGRPKSERAIIPDQLAEEICMHVEELAHARTKIAI